MKTYTISTAIACALCLGVLGIAQNGSDARQEVLPKFTGEQDINSGFGQAKEVMNAYLISKGDWNKVDSSLLYHPDQKQHEQEVFRTLPAFIPVREDIYKGQVAFYSNTYAKQNLVRKSGDLVVSEPSGHYIVGYTNGEVTKVPSSDVRYLYMVETFKSQKREVWKYVFPGMKEYAGADVKPGKRPNI